LAALTAGGVVLETAKEANAAQADWRWCLQCQGLWFNGHLDNGVCPRGGAHTSVGSGNYQIKFAADGGGDQDEWRWCYKCEGLWFSGSTHGPDGTCPADRGFHSLDGSGNYLLNFYPNGGGNQDNWLWCLACYGLWFHGNGTPGYCPYFGSSGHSGHGSGDYYLTQI